MSVRGINMNNLRAEEMFPDDARGLLHLLAVPAFMLGKIKKIKFMRVEMNLKIKDNNSCVHE